MIKSEGTRYYNLRDHVKIPVHKKRVINKTVFNKVTIIQRKTVTLQRLGYDFKMADWLEEIKSCLRWEPNFHIWVGCSFLIRNHDMSDMKYIYANAGRAPYHQHIDTPELFDSFVETLRGKTYDELLNETFVNTEDDNPFARSGFVPCKLVACYVWLRK